VTVDTVLTRFIVEGDQAVQQTKRIADENAGLNAEIEKLKAQMLELQKRLDETGKGHGKHANTLRELRKEIAGGNRDVGFFARSLNGLVPASSGAGEGIRLVTGALVGGVGLAFAIEAAMFAVKLFGEHLHHLKEEQEVAEKAAAQHATRLNELIDKIEEARQKYLGFTDAQKTREQWLVVQQQLNDARAQRTEIEADVAERFGVASGKLKETIEYEKSLSSSLQNDALMAAASTLDPIEERIEGLEREAKRLTEQARYELQTADQENRKKLDQEEEQKREERARKDKAAADKAVADMKRFDEQQDAAQKAAWGRNAAREEEQNAAEAERLIKQNEEIRAIEHRFQVLREADGDAEQAQALATLDDKYQKELLLVAEREDLKTQLTAEWSRRRLEILARETKAEKEFYGVLRSGLQTFARDAGAGLTQLTTRSRAYEQAMREAGDTTKYSADLSAAAFAAFAQNAIASVAQQAAVTAVYELAEGLAMSALSLAGMPMEGSATAHYAAAAKYGVVAALAGVAAYGIGQTRGMTRAERDQVSAFEQQQASAAASSAGSAGSGTSSSSSSGGGTASPTREYVILLGNVEYWETPAEAARRLQRGLEYVKTFDLARRRRDGTEPKAFWLPTIVAGVNDALDFVRDSVTYAAYIAAGTYYSAEALRAAVMAAIVAADAGGSYYVGVSAAHRFTLDSGIYLVDWRFSSGAHASTSARYILGFGAIDTGQNSIHTAAGQHQNGWYGDRAVGFDRSSSGSLRRACFSPARHGPAASRSSGASPSRTCPPTRRRSRARART
jgi:hypothetical protein